MRKLWIEIIFYNLNKRLISRYNEYLFTLIIVIDNLRQRNINNNLLLWVINLLLLFIIRLLIIDNLLLIDWLLINYLLLFGYDLILLSNNFYYLSMIDQENLMILDDDEHQNQL